MKAEELMGLSVVDSEEGTSLGTVKGLLIDQSARRIVALEVGGGVLSHSRFVPFDSIKSASNDVLMVASARSLVERRSLPSTGLTDHLIGRHVLTEDGKDLGTVREYSVDPQTGELLSLTFAVDKNVLGGLWKSAGDSHSIPIRFVKTLGEHLVVDNSVPDIVGMNKAA